MVKVTVDGNVVCPDEELLYLFFSCFLDRDILNFCFFYEVVVHVFLMSKSS